MVIELRVVQFWSEIILVISNQTRAARSFDFEITRMISDQIALHSVQLPLCSKLNTGYRLPYQLENVTFGIGFPVVQTDGRTGVRPRDQIFSDNQIFLPKVFF